MKNVRLTLLVALGTLVISGLAYAQTPQEMEAFMLYKQSKEEMDAGKFEDAIKRLDRAYGVFPLPQIVARKAECFEKMGDLEKALETYQKVQTDDPKLKGKVEKAIQDIKFDLNRPVELTLSTNIPDVDVTVDNLEKYKAPATIKITRGRHQFEFKKKGFITVAEEKIVKGSTVQTYPVSLQEVTGRVVFRTDLSSFAGVTIRIDNNEVQAKGSLQSPNMADPVAVRAGSHSLVCIKEGVKPYMAAFDVTPDGSVEVMCKLKSGIPMSTWGWVTVGTGAAVTGVGIYFLASYFVDKKKAEDQDLKMKSSKQIVGPVLISVGVLGAAASYFLFAADRREEDAAAPKNWGFAIAPTSNGGASAGAFLRF